MSLPDPLPIAEVEFEKEHRRGVSYIFAAAALGGIAFVVVLVMWFILLQQVEDRAEHNQINGCERGNLIKASLVDVAEIVQSNLRGALEADSNPSARATYKSNIHLLQQVKEDSRPVDCVRLIREGTR